MKSIILLSILGLSLLTICYSQAYTDMPMPSAACCTPSNPQTLTFTVQKQGKCDPDTSQVSLTITYTTMLMTESYQNVSQTTNDFYTALSSIGIQKNNISTQSFSTSKQFNYTYVDNVQNSIFVGYQTQNSLLITCDIDLVGQIIDMASNFSMISISSISFQASNSVIYAKQLELLQECSESAKSQAQIILSPLGLTQTKVLSMQSSISSSQDSNSYLPMRMYSMKAMDAAQVPGASSIQISGSKTIVSASVDFTVEYQ